VDDPICRTIQFVGNSTESVTIDRNLTITGAGLENEPIVNGDSGKPVFTILPGKTVTFEVFQVAGGDATVEQGGGILNQGTLILEGTDVLISNATNDGGGIYNAGTLYRCVGSTVYDNEAAPGTAQDIAGSPVQQCPTSPGPGGPLERESVLVEHKGKKELCLPEAALKGHLKHGDEIIDEQGCSDTDQGSRRGSK
jgi:hypothetical protein